MEKIYRCQCRNITNKKICANRSRNMCTIYGKRHCTFHLKYYSNLYVTIIQRYYKGYKQRKLLTNIYKKLPDDIQRKIIFNIRQDLFYEKYTTTIYNIISKKIDSHLDYIHNNNNSFSIIHYLLENQKYIQYVHNLYRKYNQIFKYSVYEEKLIIGLKCMKQILNKYESNMIDNHMSNDIFNRAYVIYCKLDSTINPSTTLSSES
jgi:hypothetical protein